MKQGPPTFRGASYRAFFEAAPDAIVIVDFEGRIRDLNPQAEKLFGYASEDLLGVAVERLVPDAVRQRHRAQREGYMEDPQTRPMGIGLELRARRKDGIEVPVEIGLSPLITDDGSFVIAIVRDMTERSRLRRLGAVAVRAAEDERARIARELHDDTAQRLAALLLHLQVSRGMEDAEKREGRLDLLRDGLLETAESVRRIAHGLRPPELEEIGLVPALRTLARRVGEDRGLEVVVESDFVDRLDPEAELALYRIVQEALSNSVRHAGASRLRILLSRKGEALVAVIEDDGRGFDPERTIDGGGGGLGLMGMHERASGLGGKLRIKSAPDAGTRVHVELPLA